MTKAKVNLKPKSILENRPQLSKVLTGIAGLDVITDGGLPKGRPTLVCGNAGCGKTLLAMEFIVRGATQFNENGVFMAFEESTKDLISNVASLGFDLNGLIANKKVVVDFVYIDRNEITEAGEYNLDALFIRLGAAIDSIGAKRVVLDTIESLFASLPNQSILRAELHRLFRWLKDKGVTAVITGEGGLETNSGRGLEEFVSDCVIVLQNRVEDQISSRILRIVKYRGSLHGTNEYPFLIDEDGISLIPITVARLNYESTNTRVSSGIPKLDMMFGGKGFYRGSSILVSGTAGTGKTSFMAHFADAACKRNERTIFFAFEESPSQIIRNMGSIGIDLDKWVKKGLLKIESTRPSQYGLEMHLIIIQKKIAAFDPKAVIFDPLSSFTDEPNITKIKRMLLKLVDYLKSRSITAMLSSLSHFGTPEEGSTIAISSLIDSWIFLRDLEANGERNRGMFILKSRGMSHSKQVREFVITDHGVDLCDIYVGSGTVLMGGARLNMQAQEKASAVKLQQQIELRRFDLENKRQVLDSKIAAMRAEFAAQEAGSLKMIADEKMREEQIDSDRNAMQRKRNDDEKITSLKAKRESK
jgi:circadian clock protein KaiC